MAMQINKNGEIFEVLGKITSRNMGALSNYFESLINHNPNESIILSIEKVDKMDSSGAYMLEQLYKSAVKSNMIISIIGKQNRLISDIMMHTKTSYILSNDRV